MKMYCAIFDRPGSVFLFPAKTCVTRKNKDSILFQCDHRTNKIISTVISCINFFRVICVGRIKKNISWKNIIIMLFEESAFKKHWNMRELSEFRLG